MSRRSRQEPRGRRRRQARPPRVAEALLGVFLDAELREFALGDLAEEYAERRRLHGRIAARAWYWAHGLRTAVGGGNDDRGAETPGAGRHDVEQRAHERASRAGGAPPGGGSARTGRRPHRSRKPMGALAHDVSAAARSLARCPGFTTAAIITLALGFGVTTAVFSVVDWAMIRSIPGIESPDDVAIAQACVAVERDGCYSIGVSSRTLRDLVSRLQTIVALAGEGHGPELEVTAGDGSLRTLTAAHVSPQYFEALGARPLLGRPLTAEDELAGSVVVISHRMWSALLDGSPDAIGETVLVNGQPFTIVGVADAGFHGTNRDRDDLWLPNSTMARVNGWSEEEPRAFSSLIARRRPGATWEQVEAELESFRDWLADQSSEDITAFRRAGFFRLSPGLGQTRPQEAAAGIALLAVVGLILLIACSNVAGLVVIRGLHRRGEIAVRKALGASRARLLRQYLTESALLWTLGGLAGTGLALGLVRLVLPAATTQPDGLPLLVPIDLRVLAFASVLTLAVGLLFGSLPAVGATRVDAGAWLHHAGQSASRGRRWARAGLTIVQLAAMMTLLVGSLLMIRTLHAFAEIDLGFDPEGVTVFSVHPGDLRYDDASRARYYSDLVDRLRAAAGVHDASFAFGAPFASVAFSASVRVAGGDPAADEPLLINHVGPGYFDALRIPLLRGRTFTEDECRGTAPTEVVILSAGLAHRLFGDVDPLGRLVQLPRGRFPERAYRVVGIAGDVRFSGRSLTVGPDLMAYEPFGGEGQVWSEATFMVRSRSADSRPGELIRTMVAGLDDGVPVRRLQPYVDAIRRFYGGATLVASLTGAMAALASILAAIGLYGVVALTIAERTWELGIRVALGADRRAMLALVARDAFGIILPGLLAGALGAFALGIVIESFLYGVTALDLVSWVVATTLLAVVSLIAIAIPARRATAADPVEVLRAR